ncbi:Histidine kinase-, DNA gyrase B-, and HSP90-like ATPase [Zobellia uliginosa]|uniref:Histidine kinase-, DNA gyrase B-, and HSP90-like ATPase n=1 Tax=Zobellia uliginosa TaxID=143224 RepID=A0ABY1KSI4_9FLAO|nr:Histidine kinase-, DNA gyrase B-, and HSP90-like ATPase [Zobellia uliginosa]
MDNELQFRISSGLKNIIGRDLITDDFIAIFELVKNSYDAHASKVLIEFENLNSSDAVIRITDNGSSNRFNT